MQTRSMRKKEKFKNLISVLPHEIERSILVYLKDDLILSWNDIVNKKNYINFKNYMKNGMGIGFKSEKLIRKYYIKWIKSNAYLKEGSISILK